MHGTKLRLACSILLAFALAGCQSWHSTADIPGLGYSKGERKIVKQAKNDPFPTPAQVGMK